MLSTDIRRMHTVTLLQFEHDNITIKNHINLGTIKFKDLTGEN